LGRDYRHAFGGRGDRGHRRQERITAGRDRPPSPRKFDPKAVPYRPGDFFPPRGPFDGNDRRGGLAHPASCTMAFVPQTFPAFDQRGMGLAGGVRGAALARARAPRRTVAYRPQRVVGDSFGRADRDSRGVVARSQKIHRGGRHALVNAAGEVVQWRMRARRIIAPEAYVADAFSLGAEGGPRVFRRSGSGTHKTSGGRRRLRAVEKRCSGQRGSREGITFFLDTADMLFAGKRRREFMAPPSARGVRGATPRS